MFLSIIIPCYNSSKYIANCLKSILCQTDKSIEVICVDDGSADDTLNVLKGFNERIKILRLTHKGVSEARNRGLNMANGRFVWFVDSDDVVPKNAIKEIKAVLSNYRSDIAVFGANFFSDENKKSIDSINVAKGFVTDNVFDFFVKYYNKPYIWNCVYDKEFLIKNELSFDLELYIGEDMDFQMQSFFFAKKVVFSEKIIYNYRNNKDFGAMASVDDTETKAFLHVKIIKSVYGKLFSLVNNKDNLHNWAFIMAQYCCFSFPESVNELHKVFKEYKTKTRRMGIKNNIKCRFIRSRIFYKIFIKYLKIMNKKKDRA